MQELEKILEEIDLEEKNALLSVEHTTGYKAGALYMANTIKDIIRNHMDHASDRWIPVEERLPEKPENGYQEPEYNVMIKDAIIPTTLKFTSKGKWKDDLGQEYEIIAWRPLPEPYRPERSDCNGK